METKGKKVGNDYGSRRKALAESPQQIARTAQQRHPAVTAQKSEGTAATYKQGRLSGVGAPYKRTLHHHVEAGTAPVKRSEAKPPSTKAILSFLDRIISDEGMASQKSIFKSVKEASKKQVG